MPVRFAIDRAGLVGADGPTHAGSFDITYLSTLPNFIVMAASDEFELVKMINTSVNITTGHLLLDILEEMVLVELPSLKKPLKLEKEG